MANIKKYTATILLVDADPDFSFFVERAFRKIGVTSPIHRLEDGLEAITYMMGEGKYADREIYGYPTFIMLGLRLPRADGFSVLQHLKRNPEWAVIPTVVLTASADRDDIKKAYMLGASAYHVKPLSTDDLLDQIRVLHDYWMTCETPEVDTTGRQVHTDSRGSLGERYEQADGSEEHRR